MYLCQAPGGMIVWGSGCETEGLLVVGMLVYCRVTVGGGGTLTYKKNHGARQKF